MLLGMAVLSLYARTHTHRKLFTCRSVDIMREALIRAQAQSDRCEELSG